MFIKIYDSFPFTKYLLLNICYSLFTHIHSIFDDIHKIYTMTELTPQKIRILSLYRKLYRQIQTIPFWNDESEKQSLRTYALNEIGKRFRESSGNLSDANKELLAMEKLKSGYLRKNFTLGRNYAIYTKRGQEI